MHNSGPQALVTMELATTFVGPPIDDRALLVELPETLQVVLHDRNGFVAYGGGLHVRGACHHPTWHSLRYWWRSDDALHRQFPAILATDIPFAEDALGDQFVLRDGEVHRLFAEEGRLEPLGFGVQGFLRAADNDPIGFLGLEPLVRFHQEGGTLAPGQSLSVYPPFIAAESRNGVSMRAISSVERIGFLAHLARTIDGQP